MFGSRTQFETERRIDKFVLICSLLAYTEYPCPYHKSRMVHEQCKKTCMIVGDMELLVASVATNCSCLGQLPVPTAARRCELSKL